MIRLERLPSDILTHLDDAKRVLAEDGDVLFAYLFGGLARGEATPLSDVDIAICARDAAEPAELKLQLRDKITDALGTTELDLVLLNSAPLGLLGRIP